MSSGAVMVPALTLSLSCKCRLIIVSATNIQMHFRLLLFMKANIMSPN